MQGGIREEWKLVCAICVNGGEDLWEWWTMSKPGEKPRWMWTEENNDNNYNNGFWNVGSQLPVEWWWQMWDYTLKTQCT